jgi:hypothetical protein
VNPEDHREIKGLGWLEFEEPELGYVAIALGLSLSLVQRAAEQL